MTVTMVLRKGFSPRPPWAYRVAGELLCALAEIPDPIRIIQKNNEIHLEVGEQGETGK
jgi:hypothetical protein